MVALVANGITAETCEFLYKFTCVRLFKIKTAGRQRRKKSQDLNKKQTGKDFDKEYRDDMLSDHKKAVDKFQKGSTDLKDADLKNFASQTLPKLQMHQDSIKAIAGKK